MFKRLAVVEESDGGREVVVEADKRYGELIWVDNVLALDDAAVLIRALNLVPRDREEYYTLKRRLTEYVARLAEQRGTPGERITWEKKLEEILGEPEEVKREYDSDEYYSKPEAKEDGDD